MNQQTLLNLQWEPIDVLYHPIGYKGAFTNLTGFDKLGVGIDPGRNWGLSIVEYGEIKVWWGTLQPKQEEMWKYGISAYRMMMEINENGGWNNATHNAVVEGPAFTKTHGQVHLESVRFGFALGLIHSGFDVEVVPPARVRAEVMGHARNDPSLFWPTINHNGANAVAMALYAAGVRREGPAQLWPPKKGD